jgi:hypothetical protein
MQQKNELQAAGVRLRVDFCSGIIKFLQQTLTSKKNSDRGAKKNASTKQK